MNPVRFLITSAALCLIALPALPARSETLSVRPSVEVSERYDSNVLNAPHGSEISDAVTRATPKLTATLSMFSTKVSLAGGFDAEYFARHNELDRFNMTSHFDLSPEQPLRITPQFSLLPAARYVESRDAVRRNQLSQTAVPGLAPTETQVTERTGTREYSGSLNGTYRVSPNIDFGLGGGAGRKSFFNASPALVGSDHYSANASAEYKMTVNIASGVYGTANYDRFDNKNDVRNFTAGLTGKYVFSPFSLLDARGGATWIRDDMGLRMIRPSGSLKYARKSRDFTAALSASVDYAAGSFGTETRREDVSLRFSDRFSTDWSWETSGVWQTNRSLTAPFNEDLMSIQCSAGVHYRVTEYARLKLTGEYFRQWNRGGLGDDFYRESALVGFDVGSNFPIF